MFKDNFRETTPTSTPPNPSSIQRFDYISSILVVHSLALLRHAYIPPTMHIATFEYAPVNTPTPTQGWTFSSSDRGTLDIIWGCFLTIFLCGWSTVCVNVPSQKASWASRLWRKFMVFCKSLAGPEFIFHMALGQYMATKKSVKDFEGLVSGKDRWTIRHGLLADMGGFVLHSPDFVPFPLTVSQVHYLVSHGFIDIRDVLVDKQVIEDKNKFDAFTRTLTTIQLTWFVINTVARVSLGMAISALELSTIAFIFCTLFTCFFWRLKPQDVSAPIAIELNVPLATVLTRAGSIPAQPYSYTPLDFANDSPHWFELVWRYCFNIPGALGIGLRFHSIARPIGKIWDDRFAHLGLWPSILLAFVQASFAGLHFAAWNFHFPSQTERLLWRVPHCSLSFSMVCTWLVIYGAFELLPWLATRTQQETKAESFEETRKRPFLHRLCQKKGSNSPDRNHKEDVHCLPSSLWFPWGPFIYASEPISCSRISSTFAAFLLLLTLQ